MAAEAAFLAGQIDAQRNAAGRAGAFDNQVRPAAAGKLQHDLLRVSLLAVNYVGKAKLSRLGHPQRLIHIAADDDHLAGPTCPRGHRRHQADRARADHGHQVARLHLGTL